MTHPPRIAISIGDTNGVGPEVVLKAVSAPGLTELLTPVIYASRAVIEATRPLVGREFSYHLAEDESRIQDGKINVLVSWEDEPTIAFGKATNESGRAALRSLQAAVTAVRAGHAQALVTAPINKAAMQLNDAFPYPGHTEYLEAEFGGENLMFMVSDGLRVGLVTNHVPLARVSEAVTKEAILSKLRIMNDSLKRDFGIERPLIAVLSLNPHAGDNGLIGKEDDLVIRPAILDAKQTGLLALGPFPADGLFGSGQIKKYDAVLAMYHDQGLVPFKALTFGSGVNFTAGLSAVRTSPDHGTAYDIAGKGEADPAGFRAALFQAVDISRTRARYIEDHANPVPKAPQPERKKKRK